MELQAYQPYWDALYPTMKAKMAELYALVSSVLPDGFTASEPVDMLDADEFGISLDIRHVSNEAVALALDFKVLDSDMHGGDEGVGVALSFTGYGGLVMGGYYPGNYTPEAFTTDMDLLQQRVSAVPIQQMAGYAAGCLGNPILVAELEEAGFKLN